MTSMIYETTIDGGRIVSETAPIQRNTYPPGSKTFGKWICPICGVTWVDLAEFWKRHLRRPHYQCPECGVWRVGIASHIGKHK